MLNIAKSFTKAKLHSIHCANTFKRTIVSHGHRAQRYQAAAEAKAKAKAKTKSKQSYGQYFMDRLPDLLKVILTPSTIISIVILSSLYKGYQDNNKLLKDQQDGVELKSSGWLGEALGIIPPKDKPEIKVVSLNEKYQKYLEEVNIATTPGAAEVYQRLKKVAKFFADLSSAQNVQLGHIWVEYKEVIEVAQKITQLSAPAQPKEGNTIDAEVAEKEKFLIQKLESKLLEFDTKVRSLFTESQKRKFNNVAKGIDIMELLKAINMHLTKLTDSHKKHVFVLSFPGDLNASKVVNLREEVTAVLLSGVVARGDTVVLRLDSGGGTVTGYGLAAAQLARLKLAGIKLIVCIDQVAASGGYMMAAVADEIVVSPFAVLGSVGVIATIPNVAERLEREGVVVEDITAGKYKRTMTPYKKNTDDDREKLREDIHSIFMQFKQHLKSHRPSLDIDSIATGETWSGQEALDRHLCDRIGTTDDVLLDLIHKDALIYSLTYSPKKPKPATLFSAEQPDDDVNENYADSNNTGVSTAMGRIMNAIQNRLFESFLLWIQHKVINDMNNIHNIHTTNNNSNSNHSTISTTTAAIPNMNNITATSANNPPSLSQSTESFMTQFMAVDNNPSTNAK